MSTRPTSLTSMWRYASPALILCLLAAPAFGQVPDDTVRRIAQLKVQAIENHRLSAAGQLDSRTYNLRRRAIEDELKPLLQQLSGLSPQERREAETRIEGKKGTLLATLPPQPKQGAKEAWPQEKQHGDPISATLKADVQAAAELQRRRLVLLQRRERDEISDADFAATDRKALAEIMAIRARYAREGLSYAQSFDHALGTTPWAIPVIISAGNGGTSAADYERDVALGAKLTTRREELFNTLSNMKKDGPTMREADRPLLVELMRLREKWHAAGKGREFDGEVHQRSGLPVAPWPFPEPASAAAALRQPPPPVVGSGVTLQSSLGERTARLVIYGLMVLVALGAIYLLYRSFRKIIAGPAPLKSLFWYAPVFLILWLWVGPIGYQPAAGRVGIAVLTDNAFIALGVTAVLYLFYRGARRPPGTEPARLSSILWFTPASVALWVWATAVGYYPAGPAIDLAIGRGFIALCLIAVLNLFSRLFRRRPAAERSHSTVYGTAHYAPLQADIEDETCLANGLFLGKSSLPGQAAAPLAAAGAPVCSTPEHHTLIVARTRTGKGTRVIVPTLLRYGGSALVIDPKGENAAITAVARKEQLNQSIHILNPWSELAATYQRHGFKPATYNPLDILDRDDPNAVAIALTLAGAICPAPSNAKDRYWQSSAATVLTAVFLWLADRPEEKKTLARAREIVSLTRKEFTAKYLTQMAASEAFSGAIREMAAPFIDLAEETYSGVMSNLSESTKFLSDPQVKAATAQSSFAMEDLATGKTTVYVVIPTERMDTQKTWLRLVISAAMHIFKNSHARRRAGHRCLFLIDEFAALGRLDDLPRDISTMSGFGVDFALIVQGLGQLKDHYGDSRNEILDNCAYKWFCNVSDLDSAEYVSKTLGKATVGTESSSDSVSSGSNSSSSGHTRTHGETGRPLLNPDEVLNLGRDVAIAIQPGGHPHYLRPIDYWDLPAAFAALQQEYPALYWNPPITFDDNPYFAPPPPPGGGDGNSREKEKAKSAPPPPRKPKMTADDAREILGVGATATADEIKAAHRKMINDFHPDKHGGHTGWNHFTQELNEARDLLLGK